MDIESKISQLLKTYTFRNLMNLEENIHYLPQRLRVKSLHMEENYLNMSDNFWDAQNLYLIILMTSKKPNNVKNLQTDGQTTNDR